VKEEEGYEEEEYEISFSFHFIYLHATNPLQGHRTQDKDNSPIYKNKYVFICNIVIKV
jgi:hypothetical protein